MIAGSVLIRLEKKDWVQKVTGEMSIQSICFVLELVTYHKRTS
jgi:tagatose-1,6-bisphosphate aldolase